VSDSYPSAAPPTQRLREHRQPVVFVNAVPIETAPGPEDDRPITLVRSSPKSWVQTGALDGDRRKGPFDLAVLADRSQLTGSREQPSVARSRLGVVGSVELVSNRGLELLGNREFTTGLVQWVAHQDDLIGAGRAPSGTYKLVLTESQKSRLIRQGIVVPALAVLLPLPASAWRLKRG